MAEIRKKIIQCPQGHYYDANKYADCPYCNADNVGNTFAPAADSFAAAGNFAPTVAPDQHFGGGSFTPTIDPFSAGNAPAAANDRMGKTQFVDASTPAGTPAPVVGWLVAVEGPCRGTDYRIHTGYNYIGRERGDIRIQGDATISAEKDANVTYVPQTKRFYIAHELGKNVLLVNDMPVIGGSTELHDYDRITIGTTQLLFISLCGEKFSWSDHNA